MKEGNDIVKELVTDAENSKTKIKKKKLFDLDATADTDFELENTSQKLDNYNVLKTGERGINQEEALAIFRKHFESVEYLQRLATLKKNVEARLF